MAELAGVMVGNYFLLECLAREGIVETYRARPTLQGGYDVILRLFRPQFPDPSGFREHFTTEVEKLWHLLHPHVQPLLEFGTGEGLLYTVTLLSEAETLEQLLERQDGRLLPLPLVLRFITQLCAALQVAHEQGIVHGNIQPSSILVPNEEELLLTHFGMRHPYQEGDPLVTPVDEGNTAYMPPEEALGIVRPASDIYAVGVLLYLLLTGQLPYAGEDADETALRHIEEPIPSLRAIRPELPEAVEMVVRVALSKNQEARFSDASAFAQALLLAFATDEPKVVPDLPRRRINVRARRTSFTWARIAWLLCLSMLLIGLVGTSFLTFSSPLGLNDLRKQVFGPGSQLFPSGKTPGVSGTITTLPASPTSIKSTPTIGGVTPVGGSKPPGRATPPGEPTVNTSPAPTQNATPAPIVCAQGALSFDGSPNLEPFLQQVNSDFQAVCPGISLSLRGDGSRTALNFLEQGRIDVAVTDLTARPSRKVVDHTLAVLLYALVVSPDVQVGNLSSAQLQQIYQGQITNWAQVGGPDEPITVVLRPPNDAISAIFQAFVLGGATVQVKGIHLKKDGPSVVVQIVSHLAGAISYVPYGVIQDNNVGVVSIDGVSPSTQSIQQGNYPFWSVEHLYTQGDNTALLQPYLQFFNTTGELAQMDQFGVVPLSLLLQSSISSHLPGPVV